MSGFPGGPHRFAGSHIIPHFHKNGSAMTQEERAAIAKRKGLCLQCGRRTHSISVFKKAPLTNEDVYKGICINCNPTSVPPTVLQDWEHRNPRVTAPVVPRYKSPMPPRSRGPANLAKEKSVHRDPVFLEDGLALKYASNELREDKKVVTMACFQNGLALRYAAEHLKDDRTVAAIACSQNGMAIQYSSQKLRNDKQLALKACTNNGMALQCVSETLRANKNVVLAAVESNPESLKFALGGLNQDKDCLIKAKLWDKEYVDRKAMKTNEGKLRWTDKKRKIVLSTKFSLAAESSSHATRFTLELKNHPHINMEMYVVYSPNAYDKGTCDPQWTNIDWPCRGTYKSCQKPHHLKIGVPEEAKSCWRYSFRYQLKEAYEVGGFMIQVVDCIPGKGHVLGNGQTIETELAHEIGIKIFQFFEPVEEDYSKRLDELVFEIQAWYNNGCSDMADCRIGGPKGFEIHTNGGSISFHRLNGGEGTSLFYAAIKNTRHGIPPTTG